MIDPAQLLAVLGIPEDDPRLAALVARISPSCEKGTDAQLRQVWFTSPEAGIAILVKEGVVDAVHLYSEMRTSRGDWLAYAWKLPHGLRFGMPRSEVVERFGKPDRGRGAHWGIYRLKDHGIRVGFADERLVTLDLLRRDSDLLPPAGSGAA